MGLAASTILERSAEPVTFRRVLLPMVTPGVKPKATAKLAVSLVMMTILAGESLAQNCVLAFQLLELHDARNQHGYFLRIARFDNVFQRSLLHGLNSSVDGRVGGNNDDRCL